MDATGLHTIEPLPVELFPERVRRKDEPYGVVLGPNLADFATTIPPSHVAADLGEFAARLALAATGDIQPFTQTRPSVVVQAFTWMFKGEVAAWVEMAGRYPPGSAGDDDAQFIRWRLNRVERLVKPKRWIVDLRGLDYAWGDKFDPEPTSVQRGDAECRFLVDRSRADPIRFAVAEELTCEFTDEALAQLTDSQRQPRSSPAE